MHTIIKMRFEYDELLERAAKGEMLDSMEIRYICLKAKEILEKECNVVQVSAPIMIVGDVHG